MAERSEASDGSAAGTPPVVDRTVPPGSDERASAVWALKERIHHLEGLLSQRRPFFDAQYRQSTCYLSVALENLHDRDGSCGQDRDGSRGQDRDGPVGRDQDGTPGRNEDGYGAGRRTGAGDVAGFAIVRSDGYLSLLGVAPGYRRHGVGSRLLDRAVEDHATVTCHVRATNADAIGFYADRGFLVEERVRSYYRDGTDAYRLAHDPDRAGGVRNALE